MGQVQLSTVRPERPTEMSDLAQPRGIRLDNRRLGQCHADRIVACGFQMRDSVPADTRRPISTSTRMHFDHEFEIPLHRADARIVVRMGGRPLREYAAMLQLEIDGRWTTIRLIDNHLDEHHMHRYDGPNKQQSGERFATGEPRVVLPQAIRHLLEGADATISSWKSPQ